MVGSFGKIFVKKENDYYDFKDEDGNNEIPEKNCKKIISENKKLKKNVPDFVLDKFKSRRSIRKFSDKKVDWKLIYNIIEAGFNAPVAGGIQNYSIIVIENEEKKKELGRLAFQQYWISNAPYLLVIVRDNHRLMELYPSEGELYSIQNTAAMIENMLMMAHFYDLGSCWVEAYDNSVLKEFLEIPREFRVDGIIPIGFPLENPKVKKDSTDAHVFFEKFKNKKRN